MREIDLKRQLNEKVETKNRHGVEHCGYCDYIVATDYNFCPFCGLEIKK